MALSDPAFTKRDSLNIRTLVDLLSVRAYNTPDKCIYEFIDDLQSVPKKVTYRQLFSRVRAIAHYLQELKLQDQRILLLFPPGLDYIIGFYACLAAGAIAVPTYPPNPWRLERSLKRLQVIMDNCGAHHILTTASFKRQINLLKIKHKISRGVSQLSHPLTKNYSDNPKSDYFFQELLSLDWIAIDHIQPTLANEWQPPAISANSIAFLQYTSGSTSQPKGVTLNHKNLLVNSEQSKKRMGLNQDFHFVSWLPMYHDLGLIGAVLQPLYCGATATYTSPMLFLQNPVSWLEIITQIENQPVCSGGPNFGYELCNRKVSQEKLESLNLSNWKVAVNGAEPIRPETLLRFALKFKAAGFEGTRFFPCYGLAEATLYVAGGFFEPDSGYQAFLKKSLEKNRLEPALATESSYQLIHCGSPAQNQQVCIVDPNTHEKKAPGEIGEIWIKGDNVSSGYWDNPQATEEAFGGYISETNDGPYLRTGDLGGFYNGRLFITGRIKDLIIIRGRNYYPQDIEYISENAHPMLRKGCSAAFAIGEPGEPRVALVIEVKPKRGLELRPLIQKIRSTVAEELELGLARIVLIKARTIPKTSSGKIQRRETRTRLERGLLQVVEDWKAEKDAQYGFENGPEGTPDEPDLIDTLADKVQSEGTASSDELIKYLRLVLAEKINVKPSEISAENSLIYYGLDSIQVFELKGILEEQLDISLDGGTFNPDTTLAELAQNICELLQNGREERIPPGALSQNRGKWELSVGQKALYFQNALDPASNYNLISALTVHTNLDMAKLKAGFEEIVKKHSLLRVKIVQADGRLYQSIDDSEQVEIAVHSVEGLDRDQQVKIIKEEAVRPFELNGGQLFRVAVYKADNNSYILLMVTHHIISDFWSQSLLFRDLDQVLAEAGPVNGTKKEYTYFDYVHWQNAFINSPAGEASLAFWKKRLADLPEDLHLSSDPPDKLKFSYEGGTAKKQLSGDLSRQLEGIAREYNITKFGLLLTVWFILLNKYSQQEDLIVGISTSGRAHREFYEIYGYFVNPLPLRVRFNENEQVRDLFHAVRAELSEVLKNMDYPYAKLVEKIQPEREGQRTPFFQTLFVYQSPYASTDRHLGAFALNSPDARTQIGSVPVENFPLTQDIAPFEITVMAAESQNGIGISLNFQRARYTEEFIENLLGHYENLLRWVCENTRQEIKDLSPLSAREQKLLLHEWNSTRREIDKPLIPFLFRETALKFGDKAALHWQGQDITYEQLFRRVKAVSLFLAGKDLPPETRIGLFMDRSPDLIVGILACLSAGMTYVPLDTDDGPDRIHYMITDSEMPLLLTNSRHLTVFKPYDVTAYAIENIEMPRQDTHLKSEIVQLADESAAYMIYTSGSTGLPKGVLVQHKALLNSILAMNELFYYTKNSRTLQFASCTFDASVQEILCTLISGGTLFLLARETLFNYTDLREYITGNQITHVTTPPSMLAVLDRNDLSPVRVIASVGEKCSPAVARKWTGVEHFINGYGPTEATICTSAFEVDKAQDTNHVPIGKPIQNVQVYVLDRNMSPVPPGVVGELFISGMGLARGYHGQPHLTAEKYLPNPFTEQAGSRMYRTGDLVMYRPDGNLIYIDRLDSQVKLRGFRIEVGEVEGVIKQFEGIEDVAVVLQSRKEEKRLVAFIVSEFDLTTERREELENFLRNELPHYMIPSAFIPLKKMPRLASGKIDRKRLIREIQQDETRCRELPGNGLEKKLLDIWKEVLGVNEISVNDNFFDLGGHSLSLLEVQKKINQRLKRDVTVIDLLQYPSIKILAGHLSGHNENRLVANRMRAQRQKEATKHVMSSYNKRVRLRDKI